MKGDVLEQNMKGRVLLNELTMEERSIMEEVMALSYFLMDALYLVPGTMDVYPVQELQDALGVHKGKEIAISRDVLKDPTYAVEVVAHEIAHALGGGDISETFERSLSRVASVIYSLNSRKRDILRRKLSGYWAARRRLNNLTHEETIYRIIQEDMNVNPLQASMVIAQRLSDYETMIVIEKVRDDVWVSSMLLDAKTSQVGSVDTIYRQYLFMYDHIVKGYENSQNKCIVMYNWINDDWEIFFNKEGFKPLSSIKDVINNMYKSMVEWEKMRLTNPFASVVEELGHTS